MPTRFLRKDEDGAPVHIWTEILSGHKGMVECDREGKIIGETKQPEIEKLPEQPFQNVPVMKVVPVEETPIKFQPEPVVETPVLDENPTALDEPIAARLQERTERIIEIQAKLSQMTAPEIRGLIRDEFSGRKLPVGISKLEMVEHYIELDRARA